jgi:acyl-CoA synthetase (AMP-forming)/AMP-acid ligase II
VVAWLAVARIGGLTVPLSTFSPGRELARTIRHNDVGAILTTEEFAGTSLLDRLEQGLPGLSGSGPALALPCAPFLRWIHVESAKPAWSWRLPEPLSAEVVDAAEREIFPSDALTIISTSGSTSAPKAVVHTHASLVRHAAVLAGRRGLTSADRIYSPMPFFWVGGLTVVLLAALTSGAAAVVQERFDPQEALELVERERVTQISCWPNASQAMAQHPSFSKRDLSSVRGGTLLEALPPVHRPASPDLAPMPLGMTETGGPHTSADDAYRPLPVQLRGTFGRALPGVEHRIVDTETGQELGPDALGEIQVRGPFVMDSIYKWERHETFTKDGWYPTNDLGAFDVDGYLRFTGRRGAMIKSGGSNVAPAEVELALREIPGVQGSFVFGVSAGDRGEDVAAIVVADPSEALELEKVVSGARAALSSYKVPRRFLFLAPDEVPMLPTGKPDLAALRALLAETEQ